MALTKFNKDVSYHQKLSNRPNSTDGLTADVIKQRFDQAANDIKDYINNTQTVEIDNKFANIEGAGRTNETIKGNANALIQHKASGDHDGRYFTETELSSTSAGASGASKIGAEELGTGSGNSVMSNMSWLKAQINSAVAGNITDGSLTDSKLSDEAGQIKQRFAAHLSDNTAHNIARNSYAPEYGTVDLNLCNSRGTYKFRGGITALNWVSDIIRDCTMIVTESSERMAQIVITADGTADGKIYSRSAGWDGSWGAWNRVLTQDDYNQLFQYANDGKTGIANAVTAKGVAASPTDTFATLAAKIGQISTGKRTASGTVTASTTSMDFKDENGTYNTYSITVSYNFGFVPRVIIISNGSKNKFGIYLSTACLNDDGTSIYYLSYVLGSVSYFRSTGIYANSTGFRLPVPMSSGESFNWEVYE